MIPYKIFKNVCHHCAKLTLDPMGKIFKLFVSETNKLTGKLTLLEYALDGLVTEFVWVLFICFLYGL